jgi:hypothetical protein
MGLLFSMMSTILWVAGTIFTITVITIAMMQLQKILWDKSHQDKLRKGLETSRFSINAQIKTGRSIQNMDIQDTYFQKEGNNGAFIRFRKPYENWCTEYMIEQWKTYFDSFERIGRSENFSNLAVTFMYKGIKGKETAYIKLETKLTKLDWLGAADNFSIGDYSIYLNPNNNELRIEEIDGDTEVFISVADNIQMVYPLTDSDIKLDMIKKIVEDSRIMLKENEVVVSEPIRLFTIQERNGNYFSSHKYLNNYSQDIEYPELSYTLDKLVFKGKNYDVKDLKMEHINNVAIMGLKENCNMAIFGPKGSGKTVLQDHIAMNLAKSPDCRVYQMTATVAQSLDSMAFTAFMDQNFTTELGQEQEHNNIIVIDEAQKLLKEGNDSIALIQMLDGAQAKKYNITFCLILNVDPSELVDDFYRPNRVGLFVHLGLLNKQQALGLAEKREEKLDSEKERFDHQLLNSFIKEDSRFKPGGDVYAPKGYVTVAQVGTCVIPKVLESRITGYLEDEGIKTEEPQLETKKRPTRRRRRK